MTKLSTNSNLGTVLSNKVMALQMHHIHKQIYIAEVIKSIKIIFPIK